MFEKVVIITKKTQLEELIEKYASKSNAMFVIEKAGLSFKEYDESHSHYKRSLEKIREIIPSELRVQYLDREFLPNFLFGDKDLVITLGPDGLVINTAKYLEKQPILAINPDEKRIDGVMIPFNFENAKKSFNKIVDGKFMQKNVSMAKATLNDEQTLYGVNDLFIGAKTHVSFRYKLRHSGKEENQSSSGIIVSTGAGSTGWLKSVITGAKGISTKYFGNSKKEKLKSKKTFKPSSREEYEEMQFREEREKTKKAKQETITYVETGFDWEAKMLYYSIREPFPSKMSSTQLVFGKITPDIPLEIESHQPQNGVIFSDGIEQDYLEFNSGKIAKITIAEKSAHLITGTL